MWIADHPQHCEGAATIGLELVETVPSFYAVLNEPGVNGTENLIRFRQVIFDESGGSWRRLGRRVHT